MPTSESNLDGNRREFLQRSAQAVAGITTIAAVTNLAAEEPAKQANPFGEVADFLNKGKSLRPHRFQPIKVDHAKARADYDELIRAIPEADRWKSPYPATAKNAFPLLKFALEKLFVTQPTVLGIKEFDDSEFLDKLAEAENQPIPWPQADDWAFIQKYLAANRGFSETVTRAINESDYCSEFENQELCYSEELWKYDIGGLRYLYYFLKQQVLTQVREQAWDKAFAQLQIPIKLASLQRNTKGVWLHGYFAFGLVSLIYDMCLSIARHPEAPTPVVKKAFQQINSLTQYDPDLAQCHRCEFQTFFADGLAQIPVTKSLRDQAPALMLSAYIDKPGDDVVLDTEKKDQTRESMLAQVLYFERAVPCLTNHPKPFDKKLTLLKSIKLLDSFLTEFEKHEFPNVTMKWNYDESKYLDLLAGKVADIDVNDFERLINEASSGLRVPEPLPAELQQRLTKEFLAMENPLGMLYAAVHLSSYRGPTLSLYTLANPRERRLAAKVQIASLLFERRHQRRPKNLAELVEQKLLDKEPKSAVTGDPFGYDAELGRIWRTGKDGTKDGRVPDGEAEDEVNHAVLGIYPLIGAK